MIVHIGWDACVDNRDVALVLTRACAERSADNQAYITRMKKTGKFIPSPEGERSYLLLAGESCCVVASAIRTPTLQNRFNNNGLSNGLKEEE